MATPTRPLGPMSLRHAQVAQLAGQGRSQPQRSELTHVQENLPLLDLSRISECTSSPLPC